MRQLLIAIPIIFVCLFGTTLPAKAQQYQNFAFNRITKDDGKGLASSLVQCLYQDKRGYIWVGTANGIQRFDGGKFVQFRLSKSGSDELPVAPVSQIIGLDSVSLFLVFPSLREFGIFNTTDMSYIRLKIKSRKDLPPRAEFHAWKDRRGEVFINIGRYGMMHLDRNSHSILEDDRFVLPKNWIPATTGTFEDPVLRRVWIPCDSGLAVYDEKSREVWTRHHNPKRLPLLQDEKAQNGISKIYIDKKRRFWVLGWPRDGSGQVIYCIDSTGSVYLDRDTTGLRTGPVGYTEMHHLYETSTGGFWVYGADLLFTHDRNSDRFAFLPSDNSVIGISYETIYQIMEDRDKNLWFATDRGLYFTAAGNESYTLVNLIFGNKKEQVSVTDILEMPDGDMWLACWGLGVKVVDKFLAVKTDPVYKTPFPSDWVDGLKGASKLPWTLCRQKSTGEVWIGCNNAVLMIYDPRKGTTRYLRPDIFQASTIRFITEDYAGRMWLGTQSGKLVCFENGQFRLIQDIGTIIYKIFVDAQGWIWLATHEKGLYAIHPVTGKVLQHYTANDGVSRLYSNTGRDIEQLNDSLIVYGAGVINLVNKYRGTIRLLSYKDGLPSNNVYRLRMDNRGFLWIITTNGLCRLNPVNQHITPYGKKDGIIVSEQTITADYRLANGNLVFGGGNSVLIFDPAIFSSNKPPSDVTITDFKIFNEYYPVDSLLSRPQIKLAHHQNSISIYFASLSFTERDKLTYYYKLEGIDKSWVKADEGYFANYSSLPPGKYQFHVYCESIEGIRSPGITRLQLVVRPPFWRTGWFISSVIFLILLVIYDLHNARVKRLLAVEKLRNKLARDLHDDMGSTLSTINILASMAKTKMNTDAVKTSEYLGKISENSQRMMEAMDDIVWSIKPTNDSMQRVISRMREFATSVLEAKGIDIEFSVDEAVHDARLNMEMRRDFFLVFKEAVNNAAKYSKANRVFVSVKLAGRRVVLSVKDNGVGFDTGGGPDRYMGGNGMGNMRKRAEAMSATLVIHSSPGSGTEVVLKVPAR